MQNIITPNALQPFFKLAQNNMVLLSQFSMSPEVIARTMATAQALFQQGQTSTIDLSQSKAFGELMQGMLKNYTEFMAELGQNGLALLAQGQASMIERAQEVAEAAVAGQDARGRRVRKAA